MIINNKNEVIISDLNTRFEDFKLAILQNGLGQKMAKVQLNLNQSLLNHL